MRVIISPAKKMNVRREDFLPESLPVFLERAEALRDWIRGLEPGQRRELWKCNEKLCALNEERLADMDLRRCLTPAVMAYEGIQYQYMAPGVMDSEQLAYIREHLRILSGFYGILRPFDGVTPYRLEMQAKLRGVPFPDGSEDLYAYWGASVCRELTREDPVVLNLASKEYAQAVEPWLRPGCRFVTCVFGESAAGKVVQKGTMAKMARGEMVRFLASVQAAAPEEARRFTGLGYQYREELSGETEYVFLR